MIINPIKVFGNFFDDRNISNYRMLIFGEASFASLRAALADIGAPIEAPLNAYRELLGGNITARAVLKGRTATVNDYCDAFLDTMRVTEDTLGAKKVRKGHPVYLEFFPQGLSAYHEIERGNAHALMQLAAAAAGKHADLLGPDLSAELSAFPEGWLRIRGEQQGVSGDVSSKSEAIRSARHALELALCKAMHEVGARYPADADGAGSFFPFERLYASGRAKKEPEAPHA